MHEMNPNPHLPEPGSVPEPDTRPPEERPENEDQSVPPHEREAEEQREQGGLYDGGEIPKA